MGTYLGSNLFSGNACYKNKHLCKISELCQGLTVFVHHLLLAENERAYISNFFVATAVNSLFDNPVLLKNVENKFIVDIMRYN